MKVALVFHACVVSLLLLSSLSRSQPAHPKVLFDSSDVVDLVLRKDVTHGEIWQSMLNSVATYDPPSTIFSGDAGLYGDRLLNLAMVSLVDSSVLANNGATPVIDLFLEYFDVIRSYGEWNILPTPFGSDIIFSSYLLSLALAYDWHYSRLGAERREATADLLFEKAVYWESVSQWLPDEEHLDELGNIHWQYGAAFTGNHAFRNAAGIAAVAFVLSEERETRVLIERMEEVRDIIGSNLPSDGSDSEGASYHATSKKHFLLWLEMRDRSMGLNSLDDFPWLNESIMFDLYSFLPGGSDNFGGVVQYGDAATRPNVPFFGAAGRLGSSGLTHAPVAQWIATNTDDDDFDWLAYLWCDRALRTADLGQIPLWHHFGERGEFVWRSSWEDDASHFTIKSGSSLGGHDHPDNGSIALFKAGIPYLTDYGISRCFRTDEHNVILVNGIGQYGEMEGADKGGYPVNPDSWGTLPFVLADNEFFDVLADPTPMYRDTALTSWQREVIGFSPGVFILRDHIEASQSIRVDHLLHSYRTMAWDGQVEPDVQYQPSFPFDAIPWSSTLDGEYAIDARDGAEQLFLTDLSPGSWNSSIEASQYIPKKLPDGNPNAVPGCDNNAFVTLGGRLRRTITAQDMSSISVIRFGDYVCGSIGGTKGDGVTITRGSDGSVVATVVWPNTENLTNLGPFRIQGKTGGRGADSVEYFGREVKSLREINGLSYIASNQPVSMYVRLQDQTRDSALIVLHTIASSTTVRLYCPVMPTQVLLDGVPFEGAYRWTAGLLGFKNLAPGKYRFVCRFSGSLLKKADNEQLPVETSLAQNFPNPFNPSTTFAYTLALPEQVTLRVYNALGQLVKTLVEDHQMEGYHEVLWDGRSDFGVPVASGVYIYRMTAGSHVEAKRMLLLK